MGECETMYCAAPCRKMVKEHMDVFSYFFIDTLIHTGGISARIYRTLKALIAQGKLGNWEENAPLCTYSCETSEVWTM